MSDHNTIKTEIIIGSQNSFSDGTSTSYCYQELTDLSFGDPEFTEDKKRAFDGAIKYHKTNSQINGLARYFGDYAKIRGNWVQLRIFPNSRTAKESLAILDSYNNSCEFLIRVTIPPGVRIALGNIGGGSEMQIYIHSQDLNLIDFHKPETL